MILLLAGSLDPGLRAFSHDRKSLSDPLMLHYCLRRVLKYDSSTSNLLCGLRAFDEL
jgi:hypothetical protein